jgi:hypothetical protein
MPEDPRPASSSGGDWEQESTGTGAPQGLAWSWELDFEALQAALDGPASWSRPRPVVGSGSEADSNDGATSAEEAEEAEGAGEEEDQEALLDAIMATGRAPLSAGVVAGRIAESLPAGPGLAGWLATAGAGELEDGALAGVAASCRRLASWAQAGELAAVAQIASRAAARDEKIGVDDDGRPARVPVSACAEVSLGLVMSQYGASWWTDLGVTLAWRLAATGAALREGMIDLSRARLIAEETAVLNDDAARAVEEKILPRAGDQTTAQLRTALRRAVIAADPQAAERRREEAERRAKVSLYGDEDCTATLTGSGLPVVQAAAAMARITAMARAVKASGAGGGINLHRAHVFIGLLLGTLPFIPPAEDAPPDIPPPADDSGPNDSGPDDSAPGPRDRGPSARGRGGACPDAAAPGSRGGPAAPAPADPWENVPWPGDEDAPCDDGDPCPGGSPMPSGPGDDEDIDDLSGSTPVWPVLPAVIPPAFARPGSAGAAGSGRPAAGLLDLALPWSVLAGLSTEPGHLGRIGPVTAPQARRLAEAASADPAAQWRVIVTNSAGQALAVTRVSRRTLARDGPAAGAGLVGRVTLTISEDALPSPPGRDPPVRDPPGRDPPVGVLAAALRAATQAAARARDQAQTDAMAGGCAHANQSQAYRPPPRLQEHVTARDLTCRFFTCRQPAWRGDLDHTIPWPDGPTCRCNLGGVCRTHHQIKQLKGWMLTQPRPGIFEWTTPSGRTYIVTPDIYSL